MATTALTYPTPSSLREQWRSFHIKALVSRGVPAASARAALADGTNQMLLGDGFIQLITLILANERLKEDATFPDTAQGDDLAKGAAIYGVERSPGAGASGDVLVTCTGTVTYPLNTTGTAKKNGKRYRVVAPTSASSGDPVPVVGVDIGKSTELAAGEIITWDDPPAGSGATCTVATAGLTNGRDADTDARLRAKWIKVLREPQNGGSWAHARQWAEEANANAVEAAYVYPALQGPSTVHVAYTVEGNRDNDYNRAGSDVLTQIVAAALVSQYPEGVDITTTTVQHQILRVVLKVTVPDPVSEGGEGGGWVDETANRWPPCLATAPVIITGITDSDTFTCDSTTTPVDNAWIQIFTFSGVKVHTAQIVSHSGVSGAYVINLDRGIQGLAINDYVSPALERGEEYADFYMSRVALLAPGEKTEEVDVLPRAYRHPKSSEGAPSGISTRDTAAMQTKFPEITGVEYFKVDTDTTPTFPYEPGAGLDAASDPPFVLKLYGWAVYPQ